uniref:BEN domain-containing protein n=1 Tax=Branchiostoma floridae TaxID=7739 RepID=C3Z1C1_BRAFL|eukprot:XP_002597650.1 hypothetical protein BRAFLDRAFT_77450 [Branchiostoma floridae]
MMHIYKDRQDDRYRMAALFDSPAKTQLQHHLNMPQPLRMGRLVSLAGNEKCAGIKMPIASYGGPQACGEHEDCFSELNSSLSQEQFIQTFRQIKRTVFAEWNKQPESRMPLAQLSSNQNSKPSPKTVLPVLPKSPIKLFQNVASTSSRITRSPGKSATDGEEEEAEVAVPMSKETCHQESPAKSTTERVDKDAMGNPAKRRRLSIPKTNKRDFQDSVVAMRKALIEDMEGSYADLEDNQCLPAPSATVKTEWMNILHYEKFNQVCNNAKEYKLVAQLSKRCWTQVLRVFRLCEGKAILTKEGRATASLFKPLKGLTEANIYKALSKYAETPSGAKLAVKTLTSDVQEDKVALQLQDKVRELEAENHQLRMFAVDVAQTVNSNEQLEVKIEHIKLQEEESLPADKLQEEESLPADKLQKKESLSVDKLQKKESLSVNKLQEEESLPADKLQKKESLSVDKLQKKESLSVNKLQKKESLSVDKLQKKESLSVNKLQDEERWVAVALAAPEGWHIARLESINDSMASVSFLQTGVPGMYKWPERPDRLDVNNRCVIAKNVAMNKSGTGTRKYWHMSQSVRQMLNQLFEDFKLKYW